MKLKVLKTMNTGKRRTLGPMLSAIGRSENGDTTVNVFDEAVFMLARMLDNDNTAKGKFEENLKIIDNTDPSIIDALTVEMMAVINWEKKKKK